MPVTLPMSTVSKIVADSNTAMVKIVHNMNIFRTFHMIDSDTLGINTSMGLSRARNIFEEGRLIVPLTFIELHSIVAVLNALCKTNYSLHDFEVGEFSPDGKVVLKK